MPSILPVTPTRCHLPSAVLLLSVATSVIVGAEGRVFVDQWSPTRSELYIAEP